jgi:hypothetical protein
MMNKSKATYSWAFLQRELVIGIIAIVVLFLLTFFLFPQPANIVIACLIAILGIIFLSLSIFIKKNFYGVVTEINGDDIKIYKSNAFLLKPKENELLLVYGRGVTGACFIKKDTIKSVRLVDRSELKKIFTLPTSTKFWIFSKQVDSDSMKKLVFVTDYSNVVEIELYSLTQNMNGAIETGPTKLLVSVKDPMVLLNFRK